MHIYSIIEKEFLKLKDPTINFFRFKIQREGAKTHKNLLEITTERMEKHEAQKQDGKHTSNYFAQQMTPPPSWSYQLFSN